MKLSDELSSIYGKLSWAAEHHSNGSYEDAETLLTSSQRQLAWLIERVRRQERQSIPNEQEHER